MSHSLIGPSNMSRVSYFLHVKLKFLQPDAVVFWINLMIYLFMASFIRSDLWEPLWPNRKFLWWRRLW